MNPAEPHHADLLRPLPAQSGDGNLWVDGWCWLWCGWRRTRVLWIGAVGTVGAHAPLYACGPCLQVLHDSVWDYADALNELPTDESGREIPLYQLPQRRPPTMLRFRRGWHRRSRTPLGRRFFEAITAPEDRTPSTPGPDPSSAQPGETSTP